jgi:molybdopterin molybdotransferase
MNGNMLSFDEAHDRLLGFARPVREIEPIDTMAAAGRVLAVAQRSPLDQPPMDNSAMDGYALRAADVPAPGTRLPVSQRIPAGSVGHSLAPGTAARIFTGAPLPPGADAVLPAEQAKEDAGGVLAEGDVTPGKNVGQAGEDVERGSRILAAGRRLRPQDLGLLASVGRGAIEVVRRPRVRIVATGNELLAPGERPRGNQIVDSDTPMLRALVERDGGVVEAVLRLRDDERAIRDALAAPGADVILTAGATSVGREDFVPAVVRELGDLTIHGVAMRPASPTGIGRIGAAKVFLLPGNPVSCLAAYDLLVSPALRRWSGAASETAYRQADFRLRRRIVSQIGRTDYVRVALVDGEAEPLAVSGASVLSSTTRADGFVVVDAGSEGLAEGATARVSLYDPEAA